MDKITAIIVVVAVILIVFGQSCNADTLVTDILNYIRYLGTNISDISLLGDHTFDGGFKDDAKALGYVATLPFRLTWAIFQSIYFTFKYWEVTL